MKKIKARYAILTFVVLAVLVVGGTLLQDELKEGGAVVFAPFDQAVSFSLDGGKPISIEAGGAVRVSLKKGAHVFKSDSIERTITIRNGKDYFGVPMAPSISFVELDLTASHYGDTAGKVLPIITDRKTYDAPFQYFASIPVTLSELPKEITDKVNKQGKIVSVQLVHLWKAVDPKLNDDTEILKSLGFELK